MGTYLVPGRHASDHQIRLYSKLRANIPPPVAAARASIGVATAYRIEGDRRRPLQMTARRGAPDEVVEVFKAAVVPTLVATADVRKLAIFEELQRRYASRQDDGRRALERRIRSWHALYGVEREIVCLRVHEPGGRLRRIVVFNPSLPCSPSRCCGDDCSDRRLNRLSRRVDREADVVHDGTGRVGLLACAYHSFEVANAANSRRTRRSRESARSARCASAAAAWCRSRRGMVGRCRNRRSWVLGTRSSASMYGQGSGRQDGSRVSIRMAGEARRPSVEAQ